MPARHAACALALLAAGCDTTLAVLDRPGACVARPVPGLTVVRARGADAFVDGIGVRLNLTYTNTPYADLDGVVARIEALGVRHVLDLDDPQRPEIATGLVRLAAIGARSTLTLGRGSDVASILTRHGSALEAVVLARGSAWNAPYAPAELLDTVMALSSAVRARDPSIGIIGPDVSDGDVSTLPPLGPFVDYGTVSLPYGPGAPAGVSTPPGDPSIDAAASARRAVFGDKRAVSFGIGYDTSTSVTGVSEAVQAKYVARLLLENANRGVARTYVFGLLDFHDDPTQGWTRMGLVRADGTPKPAFAVVANLLALLKDPGHPGEPTRPGAVPLAFELPPDAPAPLHHALFQKADGSYALALWWEMASTDAEVSRSVAVRLGVPITDAMATSLRGSAPSVPVAATVDGFFVQVSDTPLIVSFRTPCP
jgi:hypothetical protein